MSATFKDQKLRLLETPFALTDRGIPAREAHAVRTETRTQLVLTPDGNEDAASIDAGHRNWYQLTLCQEQRESHQEALYTTS